MLSNQQKMLQKAKDTEKLIHEADEKRRQALQDQGGWLDFLLSTCFMNKSNPDFFLVCENSPNKTCFFTKNVKNLLDISNLVIN